jgi:MoxR-like ATPase
MLTGLPSFDCARACFCQYYLAVWINRLLKTQSALLEAMQEEQVTLEGDSMRLPQPFLVLATQNPIEYEGTFPLPEAQLDRFMLKLTVGYPSIGDEKEILHRRHERRQDEVALSKITNAEELLELRAVAETVHVDADLEGYIAGIVHATRSDRRVAVGSSPRGSLAFLKMARAYAALDGRDYILPDDVALCCVCISHRGAANAGCRNGSGEVIAMCWKRLMPVI